MVSYGVGFVSTRLRGFFTTMARVKDSKNCSECGHPIGEGNSYLQNFNGLKFCTSECHYMFVNLRRRMAHKSDRMIVHSTPILKVL